MNSFTLEQLIQTRREVGRKKSGREPAECSHSSSWERTACGERKQGMGREGERRTGRVFLYC